MDPPASVWLGWFRPPGGVWEEVLWRRSEAAAWDALLDLAEPGDKTVTRSGRRPDERPRQRAMFDRP